MDTELPDLYDCLVENERRSPQGLHRCGKGLIATENAVQNIPR